LLETAVASKSIVPRGSKKLSNAIARWLKSSSASFHFTQKVQTINVPGN
jgi:hypothetical protein